MKTRPLPLRSQLDEPRDPRIPLLVLGAFTALVVLAALWWKRHGLDTLHELVFKLETLQVYWTLVATESEKKAWTWILIALALCLILALVLFHRFVWRAIFPDLVRLDERAHPGGRPEPVGRLYRTRKFQDDKTERIHYRLYYKHGHRWFPLFRFDHADLDAPPERPLFGVALVRCGRLERDPRGSRFKRVPSTDTYGAAPLQTTFRESEVLEDQRRKTSIVGPGPGMNPEVMRKKWQAEPSVTPFLEKRGRALLERLRKDPRVATEPTETSPEPQGGDG